MTSRWRQLTVVLLLSAAAASGCRAPRIASTTIPATMLGEFVDDYTGRHTIGETEWLQQPRTRYRILRWVPEQQYLIAQNDSANKSDGGKFTRIDWMTFSHMAPYEWGFCFSAYNAPTAAAAESTHVVNRAEPRKGCNGFPFSRLKRT